MNLTSKLEVGEGVLAKTRLVELMNVLPVRTVVGFEMQGPVVRRGRAGALQYS